MRAPKFALAVGAALAVVSAIPAAARVEVFSYRYTVCDHWQCCSYNCRMWYFYNDKTGAYQGESGPICDDGVCVDNAQ